MNSENVYYMLPQLLLKEKPVCGFINMMHLSFRITWGLQGQGHSARKAVCQLKKCLNLLGLWINNMKVFPWKQTKRLNRGPMDRWPHLSDKHEVSWPHFSTVRLRWQGFTPHKRAAVVKEVSLPLPPRVSFIPCTTAKSGSLSVHMLCWAWYWG